MTPAQRAFYEARDFTEIGDLEPPGRSFVTRLSESPQPTPVTSHVEPELDHVTLTHNVSLPPGASSRRFHCSPPPVLTRSSKGDDALMNPRWKSV